jgi:hypothetical protein
MFNLGRIKKMPSTDKTEIEKTVENLVLKSRENVIRLVQKSESFNILADEILAGPKRKLKRARG